MNKHNHYHSAKMVYLFFILLTSTFLFFKERSVGAFVLSAYLVSILSGLVASLVEPLAMVFVTTVFGHVLLKRHPNLYQDTIMAIKRARKKIKLSSAQIDLYIDRLYEQGYIFMSLNIVQKIFGATRNGIEFVSSFLEIQDIVDCVYGLLYNNQDTNSRKKIIISESESD